MMGPKSLPAVALLLTLVGAMLSGDAEACSCAAIEPTLLSPGKHFAAPSNARVRVAISAGQLRHGRLELQRLDGTPVAADMRRVVQEQTAIVEMTPQSELRPRTRYRVAFVRAKLKPSTIVFGTFATTGASDDQPPLLADVTRAQVFRRDVGDCNEAGTEVVLTIQPAEDPSRRGATISYGVWLGDRRGAIDVSQPPHGFVDERAGQLSLGAFRFCVGDELALPFDKGRLELAIAAFDEAGNRSTVRHATVDL